MPKNAQKNKGLTALCLFRDALLTKIEEEPDVYHKYVKVIDRAIKANEEFSAFIQSIPLQSNQYDEIMARYYASTDIHREVFTELGIHATFSFVKESEM